MDKKMLKITVVSAFLVPVILLTLFEYSTVSAQERVLGVLGLAVVASMWGGTYIGIDLFRRWANRRNLLDVPNRRSSHQKPTVRGGGIVIAVLIIVGLVVDWSMNREISPSAIISLVIATCLIAFVSWLDDLHGVSSRVRLVVHTVAAVLVVSTFGYWHTVYMPVFGTMTLGIFGIFITLFWLVGCTNAYNFMDGIDGIAGAQAVVAATGWAAIGWLMEQPFLVILGLMLTGCGLGFLAHNWSPATVFMGDVGSAFLGFAFAVLAVIASQVEPRGALVGVLMIWPFVFDTTLTIFRRWRNHENIFRAHRSHLYQRLVIAGHSHAVVSVVYAILALTGAILACCWIADVPYAAPSMIILIPLSAVGLFAWVRYAEDRTNPSHPKNQNSLVPPTSL